MTWKDFWWRHCVCLWKALDFLLHFRCWSWQTDIPCWLMRRKRIISLQSGQLKRSQHGSEMSINTSDEKENSVCIIIRCCVYFIFILFLFLYFIQTRWSKEINLRKIWLNVSLAPTLGISCGLIAIVVVHKALHWPLISQAVEAIGNVFGQWKRREEVTAVASAFWREEAKCDHLSPRCLYLSCWPRQTNWVAKCRPLSVIASSEGHVSVVTHVVF